MRRRIQTSHVRMHEDEYDRSKSGGNGRKYLPAVRGRETRRCGALRGRLYRYRVGLRTMGRGRSTGFVARHGEIDIVVPRSVTTTMAAFGNVLLTVAMPLICPLRRIIASLILFTTRNDVPKLPVINHVGITRHGRTYVPRHCFVVLFSGCLVFQCDCTSQRRRRSVTCVRQGKPVSDRECQHEPKPDETVTCYDECPASAHWETQPWQPVSDHCLISFSLNVSNTYLYQCTATCSSQQGVRHRRVVCMHYGSVVQDAYCDQRSKPGEQEWCSTNVTCASWLMSDWSPVSRSSASAFLEQWSCSAR